MGAPVNRPEADPIVPVGVDGFHAHQQIPVQVVHQAGEIGGFDVVPKFSVDKVELFAVHAALPFGGVAMLI